MSIQYKYKYLHSDISVTWFCAIYIQLRDNPDRKPVCKTKLGLARPLSLTSCSEPIKKKKIKQQSLNKSWQMAGLTFWDIKEFDQYITVKSKSRAKMATFILLSKIWVMQKILICSSQKAVYLCTASTYATGQTF